jgi:hypothetical protein
MVKNNQFKIITLQGLGYMTNFNLTLTLEEVNLLLESLGTMPYHRVFVLVNKIHRTADEQLKIDNIKDPLPELENKEENENDYNK